MTHSSASDTVEKQVPAANYNNQKILFLLNTLWIYDQVEDRRSSKGGRER